MLTGILVISKRAPLDPVRRLIPTARSPLSLVSSYNLSTPALSWAARPGPLSTVPRAHGYCLQARPTYRITYETRPSDSFRVLGSPSDRLEIKRCSGAAL